MDSRRDGERDKRNSMGREAREQDRSRLSSSSSSSESSASEPFSDSREEGTKHLPAEDVETREKRWEAEEMKRRMEEMKRRMEEMEKEMRMLKKELKEKDTEKILLEDRIREMERSMKREKEAEVEEAKRRMAKERREEWMAWEEEKIRLEKAWEVERASLEACGNEKTKLEEANGALRRRAEHYQGASIELQERIEHLEGDLRRLEGREEALLENCNELDYFRKRCVAILRGERVDTGTVREFIQDAAGKDELQLHVAVSLGLDRHVEGLLRRLNGTERNDRRWSALQLAVARGDNKTVRKLWDQRSAREECPPLLHLAAANRQRDTAEMLKKKKMKLEAEYQGVTAWDVAQAMEHWEMTDILNKRNGLMCWKFQVAKPVHPQVIEELRLFMHQNYTTGAGSSSIRAEEGLDLEQGSLEEEKEREQRGGRGGGSQIAGGGSLKYEEERGGRGGRGRGGGSQIAGGGSVKYEEEERGGRGGRGGGSEIARGGSLKYEEEKGGRGGRGRGGGSQIAGSLKYEEEKGGRGGRARGSLKNEEERGGRGRGGSEIAEEGSLKDEKLRGERGRGKRIPDYEITDEGAATKAKRGKQMEGVEERWKSGGKRQDEKAKDLGPLPRGLPNLGQTCYMNCVLQSLYHLQPLAEVFRELQGPSNQGEVVLATMNLWKALRDGRDLEGRVKHMKRVAAGRDENFRGYAQKEAHDFLAQLLDWLHTDLADETGTAQEPNGDVSAEPGSDKVESPISRLFRTTQLNSVFCGRTGISLTQVEEAALNLSLPVTREGPTSLEEVIEKSFTPQMMVWDCGECGASHECENRTDITKLPEILVLHLSRVSEVANSHQKLRVFYPAAGLQVGATNSGASRSYRLAALCCHDGGMNGGHYTAFCRVNALWFSFNDTFVRRVQPKDVLDRPSAHILFYEAEDVS